jgi:Flp pilus assembly protein TadD
MERAVNPGLSPHPNASQYVLVIALAVAGVACTRTPTAVRTASSAQCQSCHPEFYKSWANSRHGLAMQPFTAQLARDQFQPQDKPLEIGSAAYRARFEGNAGFIEETGPQGTRKFSIAYVMGGKNTYYLLTPMERGRLQVLPLAFDVHGKKWYDMAGSGARIHSGIPQAPLPWTDSAFTFNTSCYGCHASQLRTNYDPSTGVYRTSWNEPGINCETCHGDTTAHVNSPNKNRDPHIVQAGRLTPAQRNEMCAPCHAKMNPLSSGYQAGQRFFDHYDLTALESPDFYPDGRDLGENYTYTGWLLSSCVQSEKFECGYCHTSTGAFRFRENPDRACLPCHQNVAAGGPSHSHHKPESAGARCTGCHMPKTRFANMTRSDHSLLPPTPAVTREFASPNACNICHSDKDASWADALVRKWYRPAYQKPVLDRARLIDAARRRQWERAPAMLDYLRNPNVNAVITTSLLRLLQAWDDPRKTPIFLSKLRDPSPLVRAAAATGLAEAVANTDVQTALLNSTNDDFRLVRIRAAASVAPLRLDSAHNATSELEASYNARPDDFTSQANLGNFYLRRGDVYLSLAAFERAIALRPDSVGSLVNASIAYSRAGRTSDAERVLRQAAHYAPQNPAVLFNLGLLLAESNRRSEAEAALHGALSADPKMAAAAYNLAILVSGRDLKEAIALCRQAASVSAEPKYLQALAQFLAKDGQTAEALQIAKYLKRQHP